MTILTELSEIARAFWGLWLMILFVGIVAWAMWPSRKRSEAMHDAAMIPFRDDDDPANIETR
ncbi:MAG: cbb3-type cytochrome c oxidase subunit 3 [Proteobacteria bacterium]|nr:cbb3-type cytochrome c oxidase subunit 3 [Pseudomonadota bacterium]MCK4867818.1 cbb3-type cytochrome c oxidase subunit 3 [Alphaproteobacteria bacterium]